MSRAEFGIWMERRIRMLAVWLGWKYSHFMLPSGHGKMSSWLYFLRHWRQKRFFFVIYKLDSGWFYENITFIPYFLASWALIRKEFALGVLIYQIAGPFQSWNWGWRFGSFWKLVRKLSLLCYFKLNLSWSFKVILTSIHGDFIATGFEGASSLKWFIY